MNQNEQDVKLSFFRRAFLAITDFRIYPFIQREKTSSSTKYFITLITLVSLLLVLFFSNNLFDFVSNILTNYDEKVPEFQLKEGILDVVDKIYNNENGIYTVIDTYIDSSQFVKSEIANEVLSSDSYIIVNSDSITYSTEDSVIVFLFNTISGELNKESLKSLLETIDNDWIAKLVIIFSMWVGVFIAYLIVKILNVFFYILIAWIINQIFGLKLKFSNYYRVVVYALTLPIFIELISIFYLGRLPEFAVFVYQALTYIYVFYALRALKLDFILVSTPGLNFKEKVEDIIHKLENEIEDKMKKEQSDNKEEDDKKEEKEQGDEKK